MYDKHSSKLNHKPAHELFLTALDMKCPRNIKVDAWKILAISLNKMLGLNPAIATDKPTNSMLDIMKLFSDDDYVDSRELFRSSIERATLAQPEFYTAELTLHSAYLREPKYLVADDTMNTDEAPAAAKTVTLNPTRANLVFGSGATQSQPTPEAEPAWFTAAFGVLASKQDLLVAKIGNLVNRADLDNQFKQNNLVINTNIVESEAKILHSVKADKKIITNKLSDIEKRLLALEEGGIAGTTTSTISDISAASQYVNGGGKYRNAVFGNKRLGFVNIVLTEHTLWSSSSTVDEEGETIETFWVDQLRMRRMMNTKFELSKDTRFRESKAGNLVFDLKVQARTARATFDEVTRIIQNREKFVGINISLKTPNEFDISPVLDEWRDADVILKHETMRNGFLVVIIRDGDENLPEKKQTEDDKTFAGSCSRILVTNPDELASIDACVSIENLRSIASGEYFPFKGLIRKYPTDFRKKPRWPGTVNETWVNPEPLMEEN